MLQPVERRFTQALALGVAAALLALVVCSCLAHALRSDGLGVVHDWLRRFAPGVAASIGLLVGGTVWHQRLGLAELHLHRTARSWIALALVAVPLLFAVHYALSTMLVSAAPTLPASVRTEPILPRARDYEALIIAVLTTGLLHPILEEVLFRRYVFRLLLEFGLPIALGVSSIAFGLLHGWSRQALLGIAAGFVYGWLYHRSGSLIPAVVAHVGLNLLVILVHFFVLGG